MNLDALPQAQREQLWAKMFPVMQASLVAQLRTRVEAATEHFDTRPYREPLLSDAVPAELRHVAWRRLSIDKRIVNVPLMMGSSSSRASHRAALVSAPLSQLPFIQRAYTIDALFYTHSMVHAQFESGPRGQPMVDSLWKTVLSHWMGADAINNGPYTRVKDVESALVMAALLSSHAWDKLKAGAIERHLPQVLGDWAESKNALLATNIRLELLSDPSPASLTRCIEIITNEIPTP